MSARFFGYYLIGDSGFVGYCDGTGPSIGGVVNSKMDVRKLLEGSSLSSACSLDLKQAVLKSELPEWSATPPQRIEGWIVHLIVVMIGEIQSRLGKSSAAYPRGPRFDYSFVPLDPGHEGSLIGFTTCRNMSFAIVVYSKEQAEEVLQDLRWLSIARRSQLQAEFETSMLPETSGREPLTLCNAFTDYLNTAYRMSEEIQAIVN